MGLKTGGMLMPGSGWATLPLAAWTKLALSLDIGQQSRKMKTPVQPWPHRRFG